MINGPIPITADGEPIIGLSPELDNFYLCCGFTSGIAASGGAGWVMANWIVDGDPGLDLWPFDVRRFGAPHSVKAFMYERAVESYGRYYHIAWPNYDPDAGRGARRSPLHATLLEFGAVYGNKFGWERPNWFGEPGTRAVDVPSFERGPAFEAIGDEHRAVRERVAIIDMSSFSKYEVRGPGALALLQKLAGNDIDRPVGTIVYTQLCNDRGGIEADVTITRLAEDRFYFVTGSALGVRDRSTIERHIPAAGGVTIDDLTSARAVLNLCGPRSRDVLARLTDAPLGNADFPYMSARQLDLGLCPRPGAAGDVSRRAGLRAARSGRVRARSLRKALERRHALRHRQRGLSRRQQPAPREALSGLGLRHHAGLQPLRGGSGLLCGAGQGRISRPRRVGRRQGKRAAAEAGVVHRAPRGQPLRR